MDRCIDLGKRQNRSTGIGPKRKMVPGLGNFFEGAQVRTAGARGGQTGQATSLKTVRKMSGL